MAVEQQSKDAPVGNKSQIILLVEDNLHNRLIFANILEHHGYRVIQAEDGAAGVKMAQQEPPDLILMDIAMPGVDGYETTKKTNWIYPELKIIAITMYTDKAYLEELIRSGFKGCVFKNKIYANLPKAIREVMEGKLYFPDDIN